MNGTRMKSKLNRVHAFAAAAVALSATRLDAPTQTVLTLTNALSKPESSAWENGMGKGFRSDAQSITVGMSLSF